MNNFKNNEKTYHIGVLIGNAGTDHPRELLTGVYDCVREENVEITLFLGSQGHALDFWSQKSEITSTTYNYQYNSLYDYALLGDMDALIIAYGTICIFLSKDEENAFLPKFEGIPKVILEAFDENSSDTYLISDNYQGSRLVVEHLVNEHGYRKILYLSGPSNSHEAQLRKKAYLDVMAEQNIPVTDSMVKDGDFTPMVEHLVEKLLDDNKDAEAIVCGNDEMAIAAYRVCNRRNIVVGKDLAIAGYDNIDSSETLDPPLTTAVQDGVKMGYESIKAAINVCKNGTEPSRKIPAPLIVRGSCGCNYSLINRDSDFIASIVAIKTDNDHENIHKSALMTYHLAKRNQNVPTSLKNSYIEFFEKIIGLFTRIHFHNVDLNDYERITLSVLADTRRLINTNYDAFISNFNLHTVLNILRTLIGYNVNITNDYSEVKLYINIDAQLSTYVESLIKLSHSDSMYQMTQSNKTKAFGLQNMMEGSDNNESFYYRVMQFVKEHKIKNAFLYLMDEPVKVIKGQVTSCPDHMYLAAQMVDNSITVMPSKNVRITKSYGFSHFYPDDPLNRHQYSAFLLFQEEYQYGLLVCETSLKDIDDTSCMALHVSTALSYKYLREKEAASRSQLYGALNELEEKNKVLSFISTYDQLTNLYNRRGFMEQVFSMYHNNPNREALLFFFDLDHLKEINDVFGHAEGDYAITTAGNILKSVFREEDVIARLGGDEFVAVILCDDYSADLGYERIQRLRNITQSFNNTSEKAYYIEMSAGYTTFKFDESFDIQCSLNNADTVLYEAKKQRRDTVKKGN